MSWRATSYVKGLHTPGLSFSEKGFMLVLSDDFVDNRGYARPSLKELAEDCLCSRQTILNYITSLEAQGLLYVDRSTGRGRTNHYYFPGYRTALIPPEGRQKSQESRPFIGPKESNDETLKSQTRVQKESNISAKESSPLDSDSRIGQEDLGQYDLGQESDPDTGHINLWRDILAELQRQVPKKTYDTWLRKVTPYHIGPDGLMLVCPTETQVEWCEKRLGKLVRSTAQRILGQEIWVEFRPLKEAHERLDKGQPTDAHSGPVNALYGQGLVDSLRPESHTGRQRDGPGEANVP